MWSETSRTPWKPVKASKKPFAFLMVIFPILHPLVLIREASTKAHSLLMEDV